MIYTIIENSKLIPGISEKLPNRYVLKSQLLVIKYLNAIAKVSDLDHSSSNEFPIINIMSVKIIVIEVLLLIVPINIQNSITIIYIGNLVKPSKTINSKIFISNTSSVL